MSEFFKVDNGTFSPNNKYFINNVSFKIFNKGDIISLLGPSGVGKTSILRTIAGLDKLIDGEIWLDKQLISSKNFNLQPEKRGVSLTFQNNCLFPHMNLKQNIMISKQGGLNINEVDHLIKNFYLKDMVDKFPHEVSSGEAQRAALIRSIVSNPKLLLLDEPLSALDPFLRIEMRSELKALQRQLGITFVHVTHSQEEAMALSDLVLVMNAGQVEQQGTPIELFSKPRNSFVAQFIGGHNVIHLKGNLVSVREDRIKISSGGRDKITSVEYLGSTVRLKVKTSAGQLTVIQSDTEFSKLKLEPGDPVKTSWSKKDQIPLEA